MARLTRPRVSFSVITARTVQVTAHGLSPIAILRISTMDTQRLRLLVEKPALLGPSIAIIIKDIAPSRPIRVLALPAIIAISMASVLFGSTITPTIQSGTSYAIGLLEGELPSDRRGPAYGLRLPSLAAVLLVTPIPKRLFPTRRPSSSIASGCLETPGLIPKIAPRTSCRIPDTPATPVIVIGGIIGVPTLIAKLSQATMALDTEPTCKYSGVPSRFPTILIIHVVDTLMPRRTSGLT